jgi:succinate dehydrogenase / fumarate reductase membrane anchor subunit
MSHKGTSHFVAQRFTAMIMIPAVIWFVFSIVAHAGDSHEELSAWIASPLTAVPLGIMILAGFYHMRLGVSEVIDDYIHKPGTRGMLHFLNTFFALVVGGLALWSVIALTFIV